jgi:aminopeptidase N
VECLYGYDEAMTYVNGKKQNVRNQEPIIGIYGVNSPGAGDMYDKGQLVLNTFRHVLGNDSLWFSILRALATKYRYQTISAKDAFDLVNTMAGADYSYFFDQYLRHPKIPILRIAASQKGDTTTVRYRWEADVEGFHMPLEVRLGNQGRRRLNPTPQWQTLKSAGLDPKEVEVETSKYYVDVRTLVSYLDPRVGE